MMKAVFKDGYIEVTEDGITANGQSAIDYLVDVCDQHHKEDDLKEFLIECLTVDNLVVYG